MALLPRTRIGATRYEFSIKAGPGGVARWGRFASWLEGAGASAFRPVAQWLDAIRAPDAIRVAQARAVLPVRQGAAVSIGPSAVEYRLYLHGLNPETQANVYEGLRWTGGSDRVQACRYAFHFMPEAACGAQPSTLVRPWAREAFALLADEPMIRRLSGFWLRRNEAGMLDQVDLALPWCPRAGDLQGAGRLLDQFDLTGQDRTWLDALHVRHIAVPADGGDMSEAPTVTFYASAEIDRPPQSEAALQAAVIEGAAEEHRLVQAHLATLPTQPAIDGDRGAMDHFYSGAIEAWRVALGDEMHYHHALFDDENAASDDAAMLAASRRAVTELYPYIAPGTSVYDVGCGWGGPLAMLCRERGCRALGVTIAHNQFRHVAQLGLPVRWADAERTLPPGLFDCVLMLESFEHIQDKRGLLRLLRPFARRLVMRVNCQDTAPPSTNFGGSMPMISSAALRVLLDETGWKVVHWRNRRHEAGPSAAAWRRRLATLPPSEDHHLETFRQWCERVCHLGDSWASHNPLIEVVAD